VVGKLVRRILCIDGGGIKGTLPASFLSTVEEATGERIVDHFDLIAGTSTGGIIALGLGLGFGATEIKEFYENEGPSIFATFGFFASVRHVTKAKYDPTPLRKALHKIFAERRLGESATRLLIPAFNSTTGRVHIFKTSHHPRFEIDYQSRAVDVVLATAAAPTYFPAHQIDLGSYLVDGGVWAKNPAGLAAVEAVGVLGWQPAETRMLSLSCSGVPLDVPAAAGWATMNKGLLSLFSEGQSSAALGTAKILLGHSDVAPRLFRIDPIVANGTFSLDDAGKLKHLIGLGSTSARDFLPTFRAVFLGEKREAFEPCHRA
jgi:hypothetical protein